MKTIGTKCTLQYIRRSELTRVNADIKEFILKNESKTEEQHPEKELLTEEKENADKRPGK